jgi:hypothetical protein
MYELYEGEVDLTGVCPGNGVWSSFNNDVAAIPDEFRKAIARGLPR